MTFEVVGIMTPEIIEMKKVQALEQLYALSQSSSATEANVLAITSLYDRLKSEELEQRKFAPVSEIEQGSARPGATVHPNGKVTRLGKELGYIRHSFQGANTNTNCELCDYSVHAGIHSY